MSQYSVIDPKQQEWRLIVNDWSGANFLSSWEYGQSAAVDNSCVQRRVVLLSNQPVAAFQAIIRSAKRGRFLEVGGGPLFAKDVSQTTIDQVSGLLIDIAKANNCAFVRARPQLLAEKANFDMFTAAGWRRSQLHLLAESTSMIDLSKTENDLLAAMRKQTRYEIRRANKQKIEVLENSSQPSFDEFLKLQVETAKRQHYILGSIEHIRREYDAFKSADMVKIYHAYSDKELLASAMMICWGSEVDYLYGASTQVGRKLPGAYAIQWQAICDAKKSGFLRYNLWGVAPPDAGPHHRFAGVTTFKTGFGGDYLAYLPAHDLPVKKLRYLANRMYEYLLKKKRRL